jgi:hypothetical protein
MFLIGENVTNNFEVGTFNKLEVKGGGELSKEDFWQLANDFFFTDHLTLPGNWLLGF